MEKSVLISLGDSRMKEVAEVLGSKSCVRILDLLGSEELTVSELSERLKMKLNTVDYNVKKLVKAGLIERADHWWSVKGRRMISYRVSDSQIVLSPKRRISAKFLWVLGLTGAMGLLLRQLTVGSGELKGGGEMLMQDAVYGVVPKASEVASLDVAPEVMMRGVENVDVSFWVGLAGWEWFLIGAWSALLLFFVYSIVTERRNK
jgi:DNA-binding transcriptional ArsR family regulator